MNLTLESLLQGLEKQAGLVDLDKQAEEDTKKDEEHEKKEDAVEADAEKKTGEAKEALKESEEDFSKLKKMNDKEESKDEKEQTKEAQEGAKLADFIMQKVASAQLTNKETEMNKQIAESGKALADALLVKLANAGDQTTVNGIPGGVAPNKNQIDNAQLVAEHDSYIKPMPTGNGIENQGTINQLFDAIVADTRAQGATDFDGTNAQNGPTAPVEGAAEQLATPNQVQTESVEKTAAVISLVNSGIDFDSAVSMVKAAAEEIEAEEQEQVKQAAFDQLVESGVDFDLAAAMVKSAGKMDAVKSFGKAMAQDAKGFGQAVRQTALGRDAAGATVSRLDAAKRAAGSATGMIGGGAVVGAGAGAAIAHQKRAAVSSLCEAGVDFETAVSLVQAKSQELYGA